MSQGGPEEGWLAIPAMVAGIIAGFRIAEQLSVKHH